MTVPGKVSVIMPAYNEAESIQTNLRETARTLELFGYEYEIILVDDGSPDNTHLAASEVIEYAGRVRVVRYDRNRGKGGALACGVAFSLGEIIVFLDADMDLHPEQLPTFFGIMESQEADVVIGSKRHPLSNVSYPWQRRLYSAGYYTLVRLLFGLPVKDTQTGLKVFKRRVLETVLPYVHSRRFAFDIELLARAHRHGFKIVDAPVTLQFKRPFGRIGLKHAIGIGMETLLIWSRLRNSLPHRKSAAAIDVPSFQAREVTRAVTSGAAHK